jgi:hypothetical protein
VLPFENLSRDPEQEYFAEGITDDLITQFAKIGALRVISRSSVMRFKATQKPLIQIARELDVDALVEGTIARSADRVRVTAQVFLVNPERSAAGGSGHAPGSADARNRGGHSRQADAAGTKSSGDRADRRPRRA